MAATSCRVFAAESRSSSTRPPTRETGRILRRPSREECLDSVSPRIAAVLLLAYPKEGEPYVVFTRRSQSLPDHPGQISLPGGSRDPDDADLSVTALRETEEELGVPPHAVEILGSLPEVYVPVSRFLVTPYVGAIGFRPEFEPNVHEVAEVIEVPLHGLRDPIAYHEELRTRGREVHRVWFYAHGPHEIWGATARVVQEFLASPYVDLAFRRVAQAAAAHG